MSGATGARRRNLPINVKDFGARGDGAADDAPSIQAAISAATAFGGAQVYFPPGVYRVGTRITLASNVDLVGAGRKRTVIRAMAGVSTAVLIGLGGSAVSAFDIRYLKIDGDYSSSALGLNGIQITNGSDVLVRGVEVTNVGKTGIQFSTSTGCDAQGCRISYTGQSRADIGFGVLWDGGDNCSVRACRFVACNGMNVGGNSNATNCTVDGNTMDHTLCPSTTVSGAGQTPGVSGTLSVVDTTAFPPQGTLSVAGMTGALLYTGKTATSFTGCTGATGTAANGGIARNGYESVGFTSGCTGWVVRGNRSIRSGDNGISASAAHCIVEGNWIDSPQFHGILLGGDHCVITGNWIRNPGQITANLYSGFRVTDGSNSIVSHNRFYDDQGSPTMKSGITELNNSTSMTYWGNRVSGSLGVPYALTSGSTSQIMGPRGSAGVTVAGATTVAIDAATTEYRRVSVTAASTAFTIGAPTNPTNGARLVVEIVNGSGGALGAITWNAVFKLAGAFTAPADTKRRSVTFVFDGNTGAWIETTRAADGTSLTNLSQSRYVQSMAFASVMASPPTFTEAAGSTSSITNAVRLTVTDDRLRYEGLGVPNTATAGFIFYNKTFGSGGGAALLPWRVAFDHDGDDFELKLYATAISARVRVWVDGQPTSAALTAAGATGDRKLRAQFTGRAVRRIVVELQDGMYFGGVWRAPTDTISYPAYGSPVKFAVLGDSFAYGTGAAVRGVGYVHNLGRLLGWQDTAAIAAGGTGYVQTNAPEGNYSDRLPDVVTFGPDILLVTGSQNDQSKTAGAVQTAAQTLVDSIRAQLPGVLLIMSGLLYPATPDSPKVVVNTEVQAAAVAKGVPFIDTQSAAWFYGTGISGTPNGTGNADYYRGGTTGADASHPTQAGHDQIARKMAAGIAEIVGLSL